MIVDVHAHFYPSEYLEAIGRPEIPPRRAAALADYSVEERLDLMDRAGVDVQVLSVAQAQPYLSSAEEASAAARMVNDIYARLCDDHPGRFRAFAALPMLDAELAVAELDRCVDDLAMVGVTIGCTVGGLPLDDPRFEPVLQELDRRRAVVFLHPIGNAFVCGMGEYGLDWLVGAPFEDSVTALRLAFSGVADRFAGIQWIVPHLGGTIPFLIGRITRTTGTRGDALSRMWFDTVAGADAALPCACAAFGADRLLYGTDYPYADEAGYFRRLRCLEEIGLTEDEVREVQGDRAAQLLGIAG